MEEYPTSPFPILEPHGLSCCSGTDFKALNWKRVRRVKIKTDISFNFDTGAFMYYITGVVFLLELPVRILCLGFQVLKTLHSRPALSQLCSFKICRSALMNYINFQL